MPLTKKHTTSRPAKKQKAGNQAPTPKVHLQNDSLGKMLQEWNELHKKTSFLPK
jgi:hypothetical protein